jgi:hypothetical protein
MVSCGGEQSGKECGAGGHGVGEDVFVGGVGAVTNRAKAVERGDAEGGGEIAVGAAAYGAFAESEAHLGGEGFCAGEEGGADFVFERGAAETAVNFEACAGENGAQGAQALLDAAHVCGTKRTEIEYRLGALGDYVGARAAFDFADIYGDAAAKIVPLLHALDLESEFVDGVHAFLGSESGVGGAAVNDDFGFADAFAGGLDEAAGTEGGFENEDGVAAAGFGFEEFSRGIAADFFVGGPEKDEALTKRDLRFLERFQREQRLDDTRFHIKNAWTVGFVCGDAEGHFGERAGGVDGVVVAEDEKLCGGA